MTALRLFAIGVIFVLATVAWFVLGGSVLVRTDAQGGQLEGEVGSLWGEPQTQEAPDFTFSHPAQPKGASGSLDLVGSDITADFKLDQRRKGLLWYSTYVVDFTGTYRVSNPATGSAQGTMRFGFPAPNGAYDGFAVTADGRELPVKYADGRAIVHFPIGAGQTVRLHTGYRTNGLDTWTYRPIPDGVGVIKGFTLAMKTDFAGFDYPEGAVSPTKSVVSADGAGLTWHYDSLVSGRPIGIVMPKPINPGPLASRITFFAPVSLLFFFAALVLLTATRGVKLHPMHYGFLAAAFFAFHLLFAYLVDRVDINVAFAVASVTSVALVIGYLRVVVGWNRALVEIAVSQFVFLVLFSYSFFFEGLTGLAVTIGSVLTLAYFMAKTANVDWEDVLAKRPRGERSTQPSAPAGPPAATAPVAGP